MERTLIFKRATLPEDTVLLPPRHGVSGADGLLTVVAQSRNTDGAVTGQYLHEFDPWLIAAYGFGRGPRSGQGNYRHKTLTVTYDGGETETVELARDGELTLRGVQVNEDGHRTQPFVYRCPVVGLDQIRTGVYELKRLPGASYLGRLTGKQPSADGSGWVAVYDDIVLDEGSG